MMGGQTGRIPGREDRAGTQAAGTGEDLERRGGMVRNFPRGP